MTIVRHEDVRALKYCNRGARQFFERHGLDWSAFLRDGVDEGVLAALGDHMANEAIEQAKKREAQSNGRQ
jgi:hypothetical protein